MVVDRVIYPKQQLQAECVKLIQLLWNDRIQKDRVYLYQLNLDDWFALLFPQFNKSIVEKIREIDRSERFFYQTKINRYKQFSVWCLKGSHHLELLSELPNVNLELKSSISTVPLLQSIGVITKRTTVNAND